MEELTEKATFANLLDAWGFGHAEVKRGNLGPSGEVEGFLVGKVTFWFNDAGQFSHMDFADGGCLCRTTPFE